MDRVSAREPSRAPPRGRCRNGARPLWPGVGTELTRDVDWETQAPQWSPTGWVGCRPVPQFGHALGRSAATEPGLGGRVSEFLSRHDDGECGADDLHSVRLMLH